MQLIQRISGLLPPYHLSDAVLTALLRNHNLVEDPLQFACVEQRSFYFSVPPQDWKFESKEDRSGKVCRRIGNLCDRSIDVRWESPPDGDISLFRSALFQSL